MNLQWYATDKDFVSEYGDWIFRLKYERNQFKIPSISQQLNYSSYKIQIRKKNNVSFKDIGYEFLLPTSYENRLDIKKFVYEQSWEDTNEIIEETEGFLINLGYIESVPEIFKSPLPILQGAACGVKKALEHQEIISDLDEHKSQSLENMFVRLLSFWEIVHDREQYENNDSKSIDVQQKEIEIEVQTLMTKPDMFFQGGWKEIWEQQKEIRDEEWLEATLEEEREKEDELRKEREFNQLSKFERKTRLGRGTGEGNEYLPWLTTDDIPKNYEESSWMLSGTFIVDRAVSLIGELDHAYYMNLQWDENVSDIQEYFPLDINKTVELAKKENITHIKDKETNAYDAMVANFLVTYKGLSVERKEAIITSWKDKTNSKKFVNQLKLQQLYWAEQGIEVKLITEEDINWVLAKNIHRLDSMKTASRYIIEEKICFYVINKLEHFILKFPQLTRTQFAKSSAEDYPDDEIKPGVIHTYIDFLVANRVIGFDLEHVVLGYDNKISEFEILIKEFKVEEIRYPDKVFPDNILTYC